MNSFDFVFSEKLIRNKLKDFISPKRLQMHHASFTHAAVVFLIIPYKNEPYDIILIKRKKRETDKHSGEMSFPGGKFDHITDKDYMDTALRELNEELGIPKSKVQILGCIDDHLTPKGFIITPFVACTNKDQAMIRQKAEVDEILKIPVSFFANKANYNEQVFNAKGALLALGKYKYFSPITNKKYTIFGATAHIIVNYIEKIYNLRLISAGARRAGIADIKDKIVK
ncbi:MAG: NUDIX hydrolase [Promethearchaeota archaeon]|jgi:8-oxo-dGTP pyrophosphatase MutT (NUDIX family)